MGGMLQCEICGAYSDHSGLTHEKDCDMINDLELERMLEYLSLHGTDQVRKKGPRLYYVGHWFMRIPSKRASYDDHCWLVNFEDRKLELTSWHESGHNGDSYGTVTDENVNWKYLTDARESIEEMVKIVALNEEKASIARLKKEQEEKHANNLLNSIIKR